jgi:thermitase
VKPLRNLAYLSLTAFLASCGTNGLNPVDPSAVTSSKYLLTVSTRPGDSAAGLESRYQGKITSYRPEAGFAVLGVNLAPDKSDARVLGLDANDAPVTLPEIRVTSGGPQLTPQVDDTESEGAGAWSGGAGAWSGGWGDWSNGLGSSLTPLENAAVWAQIHLPQAQKLAPNAGSGVVVAVIDTGIDLNHPAFKGHLVAGWDFVENDATPQEGYVTGGTNVAFGHGTSAAGIILEIAQKATIMPLRALNQEGRGDMNNVVKAIDWAISHGAQVINLSLGAKVDIASLNTEMAYAVTRNVVFVASSGNSGDTNVSYPAAKAATGGWTDALIGVGSVSTTTDLKSSFSTYGPKLNMVAPGEKIYGPYPNNQVANATGTSFAAPTVTGGVALALGQGKTFTAASLAMMVWQTADPLDAQLGRGRLNLESFMKKAMGL